MGNQNSNRGCRRAVLCALFGIALSGATLADSSLTATTSSPSTVPKPQTTQTKKATKSSTGGAATHKSTTHARKSTGQKTTTSRGKKASKNSRNSRKRGQQAIDRDRARSIQEALIREHYLQGAPSGTWDATTQAAMQRYQADQGWQSKTTPDSRALIKLGLGPSNDHLLNPESAMTSAPAAGSPKTTKPDPAQSNLPHQ
jgi:putative salt-induced outer membrane protein YdiY